MVSVVRKTTRYDTRDVMLRVKGSVSLCVKAGGRGSVGCFVVNGCHFWRSSLRPEDPKLNLLKDRKLSICIILRRVETCVTSRTCKSARVWANAFSNTPSLCSSVLFEFVSEEERAFSRVKRLFQHTPRRKQSLGSRMWFNTTTHNFKREARRVC